MASYTVASNPYAAALDDLRRKRDKIDETIRALEEISGLTLPTSGAEKPTIDTAPQSFDTAGAFRGMSIVDATKKLLANRKETMGNAEITRELQAGGLVLTGADPVNAVSSVLTRRFNQNGDVVRVERGIWGLKEWYPSRNFKQSKIADSDLKNPSPTYELKINDLGGHGARDEDDDL